MSSPACRPPTRPGPKRSSTAWTHLGESPEETAARQAQLLTLARARDEDSRGRTRAGLRAIEQFRSTLTGLPPSGEDQDEGER